MGVASSSFEVLRPASITEAVACTLSAPAARLVAGGTALQLHWSGGNAPPRTLIALGGIAGLRGVIRSGTRLRIGALTPLGELQRDRSLASMPLLTAAIPGIAAPSVRNLATIGGNVAERTGCLIPALLALDATLVGHGPAGPWQRRLDDWLSGEPRPGEIIEAVDLPGMPSGCRWTQRKIGLRAAFTPSVIGVAALLQTDGGEILSARLAVGGGIVAPMRLKRAEAWLIGRTLDSLDWPTLRAALAAEIVAPDDDFRSGRYRKIAASNALVSGLGGSLPVRGSMKQRTVRPRVRAPAGEIRLGRLSQPARWHIRPDGPAKIAGSFAYLTDYRTRDMLVGRILRAGRAHARIVSIDTARAEALPGVVAVVTHRDVRGLNAFGILVQDQPALCHDKIRYIGDAVAAVAAVDEETAETALRLIDVVYESLPIVASAEQALSPDSPRVHGSGNLQRIIEYARGDIAAGFSACTHVLEDTYVTPRQMHGFMETEGGWAALDEDGNLTVHAGGQHAVRDRRQLSRILGIPEEAIRVVTSPTGGAFGGKDELTVQPALALLALKSRRPVRIKLSRAESVLAGTKRHPMVIRMRTGCAADGLLLAQEVDVLADAGAYASLGPSVLETALEHAAGPYEVANVKTRGRLVYTNNGVCGAFRGFGANQMSYALECQMDRLAQLSGLSPVDFRRRNLNRPGGPGYFGQALAPSDRLAEMLTAAAASPLWQMECGAETGSDEVVGVGMAMNHHGNGLGSVIPDPGGGRLRFAPDGRIEACFTFDEMGQGLLPSILSIVSAQLGCGRDDIRPVIGDAATGPDSGSTTAARSTFVVWQAARLAGPAFSAKLCAAAAKILGRDAGGLKLAAGGIADGCSDSEKILIGYGTLAGAIGGHDLPSIDSQFDYPKADYSAGNARFLFASGACIARVAVSRVTGEVRVLDLDQRSAAGPVVDIAAYLGQQEGGAIQGMGGSLSEDAIMRDGAYLTANFDTYMMPGIADTPARMLVHALEELDPGDCYGPRGVGELGIGAVTPAIANAVLDAIGVCPTVSPISPESILDALEADR